MNSFLKKLARFSLKHPFWGNFGAYCWWIVVLAVGTSIVFRFFIDSSSWSTRENFLFVAITVSTFAVLFLTFLFLPLLVNGVKRDLPEVVIPSVGDIFYNNPQHRPIIGRLIRIAGEDDDADLLRRWILFFNQKAGAEAEMESFEMQFLSKG